jgi:hypothetical protein
MCAEADVLWMLTEMASVTMVTIALVKRMNVGYATGPGPFMNVDVLILSLELVTARVIHWML